MKKYYSAPELEVRKYLMTDIFTDSDPGLHDGDDYDLDGSVGGSVSDDVFA